ncbi:MAG: efflux RND transporter periplasmic adaptor subunit [Flavobacteriales bacterium]|nr:efflux RND transporter periplasmic adaptor subunit [Flavobacteriales bacterium]
MLRRELKNLIFSTLVVLSGLVACKYKNHDISEQNVQNEFQVIKVIRKDVVTNLEYVADIQAVKNVEIRARVEGYLDHILVDEGNTVKKGQVLFKINDEEYRAAMNKARANLKVAQAEAQSAQIELDRVKLLVEKNVVAKTELDLARAKLSIAEANIEEALAEESHAAIRLSNTEIKSPFDGTIDRIPFKVGSLIREGDLLTSISDINSVYAYFSVSEVEYLEYFRSNKDDSLFNQKVELVLADGSVYPIKGKIETMGSEFEQATGAIALRAIFNNRENLLKHGSTGKIRLKESIRNALLVPQRSTMEIQDKLFVMVVENNMTKLKSFEPLQRYGHFYIVKSGLTENDVIVYEGIQNLQEGSMIQPVMISEQEVFSKSIN